VIFTKSSPLRHLRTRSMTFEGSCAFVCDEPLQTTLMLVQLYDDKLKLLVSNGSLILVAVYDFISSGFE
jgi:hypothetical protein